MTSELETVSVMQLTQEPVLPKLSLTGEQPPPMPWLLPKGLVLMLSIQMLQIQKAVKA